MSGTIILNLYEQKVQTDEIIRIDCTKTFMHPDWGVQVWQDREFSLKQLNTEENGERVEREVEHEDTLKAPKKPKAVKVPKQPEGLPAGEQKSKHIFYLFFFAMLPNFLSLKNCRCRSHH